MENLQLVAAGVLTIIALLSAYVIVASSSSGRAVLKKDQFQDFPLIQKTVLSHNSAIYRFALPKPNDTLGLPIGQHISIGAMINGKEIVRSYTPTTLDTEKGHFDLLIKSYPNGNISKYVAELNIGDSIKVRGPKGFFEYQPNASANFGMVAGGTGIAPMYQIIQAIAANPEDKTKVTLIYGNVTEEDILLKQELDQLAAEHSNIKVHYVLDKPPKEWSGRQGYITQDMLSELLAGPEPENRLLMCGPPLMVSSIKKSAVSLGYAKAKPISKADDQVFVF
ncbi:cytochrome-b5 reductase [Saccharomycopsis crataegensis]|uniref:NADH-cytochrome b5 reductase n=1 Tax=Saccharomycopsis crataegensis TaxID=43959 RepID=A0AAV5QRV6_9ASCO|nr:cytochrome-b5 reductase [Saccharomycopsis crataegensis]